LDALVADFTPDLLETPTRGSRWQILTPAK